MTRRPVRKYTLSAQGKIAKVLALEKVRTAGKSHNALCRAILDYLAFKKIPASLCDASASFNRQGRFMAAKAAPGMPDILACFPTKEAILSHDGMRAKILKIGVFIGIEVKTGSSKPRKNQEECHAAIRAAGGTIIIARSLEDVIAVIK